MCLTPKVIIGNGFNNIYPEDLRLLLKLVHFSIQGVWFEWYKKFARDRFRRGKRKIVRRGGAKGTDVLG